MHLHLRPRRPSPGQMARKTFTSTLFTSICRLAALDPHKVASQTFASRTCISICGLLGLHLPSPQHCSPPFVASQPLIFISMLFTSIFRLATLDPRKVASQTSPQERASPIVASQAFMWTNGLKGLHLNTAHIKSFASQPLIHASGFRNLHPSDTFTSRSWP